MSQCYSKLHNDDYELMKQNAVNHINTFRLTGRLTNDEMDATGIWKCDNFVSRDERVLSHQGAVLITNKDTIERYINYKQVQEDNHNPIIIAQRKELAKALKVLAANEALQAERERKEAAAAAKAEAVRVEKHRVSLLTVAQKKSEALAKKVARAKVKEDKEQKRLNDVKAARLLVERGINNNTNNNNSIIVGNLLQHIQDEEEEGNGGVEEELDRESEYAGDM